MTDGWESGVSSVDKSRALEYTERYIRDVYEPDGELALQALVGIPTIFASETAWNNTQPSARVGNITRVLPRGSAYQLEFVFDPDIAPIPNSVLISLASELQIDMRAPLHEFTRNHWSVKDVDLFKVLLKRNVGAWAKPKVFKLNETPPDPNLLAVMMPFNPNMGPVVDALGKAAAAVGMTLKRADDIWIHDHIIQDVVTLLCQAKVVICDLTDRNANVFYEMGIAHCLPREVIMITQHSKDVPFDVQHIRYITYLNNGEGLLKLTAEVTARLQTLKSLP
ncbi:MAG: hypothetical protein QM808_09145 [Steroidobacteraceae bacterium]